MTEHSNQSALSFPCRFPIKAMGHASEELERIVTDIVRVHAPELKQEHVSVRPSSNGKYLSITVTVHAQSRAQLDAIYQDLTDCQQVIMAL